MKKAALVAATILAMSGCAGTPNPSTDPIASPKSTASEIRSTPSPTPTASTPNPTKPVADLKVTGKCKDDGVAITPPSDGRLCAYRSAIVGHAGATTSALEPLAEEVEVGDGVKVEGANYVVTSIVRLEKLDVPVWVFAKPDGKRLALVTCWTGGNYSKKWHDGQRHSSHNVIIEIERQA